MKILKFRTLMVGGMVCFFQGGLPPLGSKSCNFEKYNVIKIPGKWPFEITTAQQWNCLANDLNTRNANRYFDTIRLFESSHHRDRLRGTVVKVKPEVRFESSDPASFIEGKILLNLNVCDDPDWCVCQWEFEIRWKILDGKNVFIEALHMTGNATKVPVTSRFPMIRHKVLDRNR